MKDYYAILGIAPDAEIDAIKAAYRQLAQAHHPDLHPGDPDATERFLVIKEAYNCLADPDARAEYDEAFVAYFPGYTFDDDSGEVAPAAPATPTADSHDDGSTTLFRMFVVLLLPLVAGGLVMNFTGDAMWTLIAAVGGLAAAVWIAAWVKPG